MKHLVLSFLLLIGTTVNSQEIIEEIKLESMPSSSISKFWLKVIEDGSSQPIVIPILIAKGSGEGPVLGLVAAIHGNELNGIRVIQRVFEDIDLTSLKGTILAVPGLNQVSISQDRRRFFDHEDLNRLFPGKEHGNRSQKYVWQINKELLSKIDYLIDMHTASFGRENSLYVRADFDNDTIRKMALLQDADIVLKSKGPSAGTVTASTRSLRFEATLQGVPTITVEYGNPQVFQSEMIDRGVIGVKRVLNWLNLQSFNEVPKGEAVLCKKSYWIYVDKGGILEVPVSLNQKVKKDEIIGILRNPFGEIIKTYLSPEEGIVIGRSTNPINMSGGRIIHLGVLEED